jgi:taurine dioxygenase
MRAFSFAPRRVRFTPEETAMSKISVQPVGHACGARVTGVDLSRPISPGDLETICAAWLEYLVLVFPGQTLDPLSLVAFTRNFGELDDYATQPFNRHAEIKEVFVLTNKRTSGKPSPTYNSGQNWHTDLSYTLRPAKGTSVYCVEKPSVGGDTMFANMYLAYERLSPKMREFLDGLECVHDASLIEGLDKRGPEVANEFRRLNPPVVHPAVRVHPESGRKALYVNERVRNFLGLSEAESRPIVKFLCEHSVQPRLTYRHYWSVGDLVMWDNRCLVHLAVGDYDPAEIRHMIRTSGMGDYYGRYLDPETAAAQMGGLSVSKDKKAVAALRD